MTVCEIVEQVRTEPWRPFSPLYNCIGKCIRFKRRCHKLGTSAKLVIALVAMDNRRFRLMPRVLVGLHAWVEIDGQRIELARPLNQKNTWGEFDTDIREIAAMRF